MAVIFPDEMVTDVLERLPVKSLMRFKCVQRSWDALFKTHSFMTRHKQRQSERSDKHVMIFENYVTLIPRIRLLICNEPPHFEIQDLQHPFPSPDNSNSLGHISSHGHHNGVFCVEGFFRNSGGIFQTILWNPATADIKVVPPPPKNPSGNHNISYTGFGVDPNTLNDFKIIKLYLMFNNETGLLTPLAQVYNLRANSWAVIHNAFTDDTIDHITTLGQCPFYETSLASHWLFSDHKYILYFDFSCNQFQKLDTPPVATSRNGYLVEANDGSVAYVAYKELMNSCQIEIWIFKHDRWTKNYNIEPLDLGVRVYAVWNDGAEFLGGSPSGHPLVLYNSDAQPMHTFEIYPDWYCFIHKYVESLAPLSINQAC